VELFDGFQRLFQAGNHAQHFNVCMAAFLQQAAQPLSKEGWLEAISTGGWERLSLTSGLFTRFGSKFTRLCFLPSRYSLRPKFTKSSHTCHQLYAALPGVF